MSRHPDATTHDRHSIDISVLNPNTVPNSPPSIADPSPPRSLPIFSLLGLRHPLQSSYFTLYRPLTTLQDRCILFAAVVLALAAGVPLPLIGVIFGKIINSFPPTEEEIKTRIGQLLGVAVAYFFVTWGWATCWGVVGERVSRGLREALLEKAVGQEVGWFEVECPDVSFCCQVAESCG